MDDLQETMRESKKDASRTHEQILSRIDKINLDLERLMAPTFEHSSNPLFAQHKQQQDEESRLVKPQQETLGSVFLQDLAKTGEESPLAQLAAERARKAAPREELIEPALFISDPEIAQAIPAEPISSPHASGEPNRGDLWAAETINFMMHAELCNARAPCPSQTPDATLSDSEEFSLDGTTTNEPMEEQVHEVAPDGPALVEAFLATAVVSLNVATDEAHVDYAADGADAFVDDAAGATAINGPDSKALEASTLDNTATFAESPLPLPPPPDVAAAAANGRDAFALPR